MVVRDTCGWGLMIAENTSALMYTEIILYSV